MTDKTQPLVYVNVLAWNGQRWLSKCLDSLIETDYDNFRILVVDNHSTDLSVEIVRKGYPGVEVIENRKNYGFAEGHNIGIRYCLERSPDYIALLNQDTVVDACWLRELIEAATDYPEFGVLSPMQRDYEGRSIDPVFLRILNQNDQFRGDRASGASLQRIYEVPCTFGAAMLFRRETFLRVGLFDPLFFMYSEEVDFFQRARYRGIRTAVVTTSKINHWHASSYPERKDVLRISYFAYRNRYMSILKDPGQAFGENMRRWIATLFLDLRGECSSRKGLAIAAFRLLLQVWLIVFLPVIAYKRSREKRRPCYL